MYENKIFPITSLLTLLAVQPEKRASGGGCGHLPEQRGEQQTSENRNHIPCHADTTQEGQPAAALEEGLGRAGFVCSATCSPFLP